MAEAKFRGKFVPKAVPSPKEINPKAAKAFLKDGMDQIADNVSRYGYKEDKAALTLLQYALEEL